MPDFDLRGAGEIMTEGVWPKFYLVGQMHGDIQRVF
jgi:hypothetical protein